MTSNHTHRTGIPAPEFLRAPVRTTPPLEAIGSDLQRSISRAVLAVVMWMFAALSATSAFGQVSPEEHASHHPGQGGAPATMPAGGMGSPGGAAPSGGMGGMRDMMKMMEGMGKPPTKELYPSLMSVPELSPEKRNEVAAQADQRMQSGLATMGSALDRLNAGLTASDFAAMQDATTTVREGLAQFESGVAARRALAEGKPPRDVALQWFRSEMSLPQPTGLGAAPGIGWFHTSVMALLVGFAVTMIAMYFFKMRRATLLLRELTGGAGAAPASSETTAAQTPAATPPSTLSSSPSPRAGKKWSGRLRVGRIFQETPNVKTFRLMNPLGGPLPFDYLPGQFLAVAAAVDGKTTKRSYTIASSPTQHDFAELTVKHEEGGVVSGFLHDRVHEGDLLDCSGPAGVFTFTGRECKCILLIAGGVGVTPMMSVVRYLTDRSWDGDIYLLYSVRSPQDVIFREEIEHLQRRHPNFRAVVTASRSEGTDWKGPKGRITKELITQSVPDLATRYVHICGPVPMMEATRQMLTELGVPPERIKVEAFGPALGKAERPTPPVTVEGTAAPALSLPTVTFSKSDKSAPFPPDKVVLDVAEDNGVEIDYSCRVGTCGVCRVKLLAGAVTMAVEDGLEPGDKEKNIILACQAKASEDVVVEA